MTRPSENLTTLGLTLPPVTQPVGAYVPIVRFHDLLLLSGQIPVRDGALAYAGKAGAEQTLDAAQAAARLCTLNAVAIAASEVGDIDNVARVLKVVVYVASAPGFTDQHKVANGASALLAEIFDDAGVHARAAVGVAELPMGATVEVDITFAVTERRRL